MANENSRYRSIPVREDQNGQRILSSVITPNPTEFGDTIKVESELGDRLDLLAKRYYGNANLWWVIARANNLGKGDLTVPPDIILEIPTEQALSSFFRELDRINQ